MTVGGRFIFEYISIISPNQICGNLKTHFSCLYLILRVPICFSYLISNLRYLGIASSFFYFISTIQKQNAVLIPLVLSIQGSPGHFRKNIPYSGIKKICSNLKNLCLEDCQFLKATDTSLIR